MNVAETPRAPRTLLVTAAILRSSNRFLIAQRTRNSQIEPNKWEFPGGKVEFGEHPEACLVREIKEELGLAIEVESLFDLSSHVYTTSQGPVHIVLLFYFCRLVDPNAQPEALAVQEARWVEAGELAQYDFAAADVDVVQKLSGTIRSS